MISIQTIASDLDWVRGCLEGDSGATERFASHFTAFLRASLVKNGAKTNEAEDIAQSVVAECLLGNEASPPLLEKYNGRSSLMGWLSVVAINRWISLKRQDLVHARAIDELKLRNEPGGLHVAHDSSIRDLLECCIRKALNEASAESVVLLRLAYQHGISQRDLAKIWGWHESKVSRVLKSSAEKISMLTLEELHRLDPHFRPTWDDFRELCDGAGI